MINLGERRNFSKLEERCFSNWGEEFSNLGGGIDKIGRGKEEEEGNVCVCVEERFERKGFAFLTRVRSETEINNLELSIHEIRRRRN